jgi:hypothetical protein
MARCEPITESAIFDTLEDEIARATERAVRKALTRLRALDRVVSRALDAAPSRAPEERDRLG